MILKIINFKELSLKDKDYIKSIAFIHKGKSSFSSSFRLCLSNRFKIIFIIAIFKCSFFPCFLTIPYNCHALFCWKYHILWLLFYFWLITIIRITILIWTLVVLFLFFNASIVLFCLFNWTFCHWLLCKIILRDLTLYLRRLLNSLTFLGCSQFFLFFSGQILF